MSLLILALLSAAPARATTVGEWCTRWLAQAGRDRWQTPKGPADPLAHVMRAAPGLFPDVTAPPGPFPVQSHYGRSEQSLLDEAQAARSAARGIDPARVERVVHDRVVVMTHVPVGRQRDVAQFVRSNPRYEGVPKLGLVSPHFPVEDRAYLDEIDVVLLSDHGETAPQITARELILLGGFEHACLANALLYFVRAAVEADLYDFVVRVPVRYTEANVDISLRMALEDFAHEPEVAKRLIDRLWVNFEVVPGTLRAVEGRLEFDLLRGAMKNHVPKNRVMTTFHVILE